MPREAAENDKLHCNKVFYVATQDTHVVTKTRQLQKKLCRDIANLCCDRIQEESMKICRDRNCRTRQELDDKDEKYVAIELSMLRQISQLGQNFLGSTILS